MWRYSISYYYRNSTDTGGESHRSLLWTIYRIIRLMLDKSIYGIFICHAGDPNTPKVTKKVDKKDLYTDPYLSAPLGPYMGFYGSLKKDVESNVFYGRVVGIQDVVTYESDRVESIDQAFMDSVDEYLLMLGKTQ